MKPPTARIGSRRYVAELRDAFAEHADPESAFRMKFYLKGHFEFFGIKTPLRRVISKEFIGKRGIPHIDYTEELAHKLFDEEERELHHFSIELMPYYRDSWTESYCDLFESMAVRKSWWDSVDSIRSLCLHEFFLRFPEQSETVTAGWLDSGNLWLQRLAVTFQIGFRKRTDTKLLAKNIDAVSDSDEFFIQKAIGWALRDYGKTDPGFVERFVLERNLKPLSEKEALRRLKI
ncbi:MAG: DNA alkylation repair protein [Acidobacteria bacterium]|nr:MAG: DNA alkylation repair protein [Acidobacteriota bacterium]REJ99221.1 MAG: DNA alkylation repair protein [Acidobacteriota bacterium]REK16058.1 MAG: DNA alkylation repair protein [Acidobacteriota bacterium]REK43739.1 MAG: DNA alkylation repair protein [Acidobacteriota bacterium]